MSTQQNNAEAADGHSFADKIGQLVSAKYQALFGTTTYSKRRVMSGVVMTRYVGSNMVQWTLVIVNSVLSPILFTNEVFTIQHVIYVLKQSPSFTKNVY